MDERRNRTRKRLKEKQKSKQITIMLAFGVLFALMLILTIKLVSINDNQIETSNLNVLNNDTDELNNEVQNIEENVTNENTNYNVQTNRETEELNTTEEIDFETYKNATNNREKAVEIVKNNWGEDSTVYFTIDENDYIDENGNYIVSIRDSATTYEIERCKVNIETGACTY